MGQWQCPSCRAKNWPNNWQCHACGRYWRARGRSPSAPRGNGGKDKSKDKGKDSKGKDADFWFVARQVQALPDEQYGDLKEACNQTKAAKRRDVPPRSGSLPSMWR